MHYEQIKDPDFWKKYVPEYKLFSEMDISQIDFQHYAIKISKQEKLLQIRSMLSIYEISLLYAVAKDYYSGTGKILDLGPFLGISTNALSRGLRRNSKILEESKKDLIYSYDIFLSKGYEGFLGSESVPLSGSVFSDYLELNKDFLDYLVINPGDLLDLDWKSENIEILFIDIAKSWDLNNFIVYKMFPYLIPERSIVIQQDYIHFNEYWIHITMEYFSEYFELLDMMYSATAVFGYKKKIPDELFVDLSMLDVNEKSSMLERARDKAPSPVKEVMKCAHAKMLFDHEYYDDALSLLKTVDWSKKTVDPVIDVSEIAYSNATVVNDMIVSKIGKSAF